MNIKKLTNYIKCGHFWIEVQDGEAFIGHPFFFVRLPISSVPEAFRPEREGTFQYHYTDTFTGLEPCTRSVKDGWDYQMSIPSRGDLTLTDKIDLVERSKYCVLTDEFNANHWLSHDFVAIVGPGVRYEMAAQYAVRVYALGDPVPIAVLSERTEK